MTQEGPALETLTRRLAECPVEFLRPPRIGSVGKVKVAAIVSDTVVALGGQPVIRAQALAFQPRSALEHRNRLSIVLVACWLLNDRWFQEHGPFAQQAYDFLAMGLFEPAQHVKATLFVSDPDRREELARLCLKALGLRPAGESEAQAQDRLTTLNTAERERVIRAAREAEERARQVREAMAAQAAQEAADKWSRE